MKKNQTLVIEWNPKHTQLDDITLTQSVRDLLIEKNGKMYINNKDLNKIMVEAGGSPFTYCFTYSESFPIDRWFFNKSELMEYMDIENEEDFDWEEGWNYMDGEGWFNWKNIGDQLSKIADDVFYIENKVIRYEEVLIPMEWVLSKIESITNNDFDILFSTDDWYHTICNQHFSEY